LHLQPRVSTQFECRYLFSAEAPFFKTAEGESVLMIKEWNSDAVTIRVNHETCVGRGECVEVCPSSVYELKEGKAVPVGIDECIECCSCVAACPEHAIEHSSCR